MMARAVSLPRSKSWPAYTSSVFSRKITKSTWSAYLLGLGTPGKYFTGRTQA